jgi:hypothetical protein
MAKEKNMVEIAGCKSCAFFSGQKNCIKYGYSSRDINTNPVFNGINCTFKIGDAAGCRSYTERGPYERKARRAAQKPDIKVFARNKSGKDFIKDVSGEDAEDISRKLTTMSLSHYVANGEMLISPLAINLV